MNNRWLVLAAGCVIQTILGGIYAWSTFIPYLIKDYGLSTGQCGLIFGLAILVFTLTMTLSGWVLAHHGPRFTAGIAAGLFMAGYILASVSGGSFIWLLLGLGVVAGAGIGFGYVCPLSVCMKWFPKKKGLVTGVAVSGFGGGAILLSSIAEILLTRGMDVLSFFRWFGIGAGLLLCGAALLLVDPPGAEAGAVRRGSMSAVSSPPFALVSMGMFAGTFAGLLIIGNLSPLVMKAGLTEGQATISVSVFAVGNALGRIAWGQIFDRLKYRSIPLSLVSFALTAGLLLLPLPMGLLFIAVALLGFGFGANFVIYASTVSRYFGTAAFPRLYPICFLAYGIAGFIGPGVGGFLADLTGTYALSLAVSIALVLAVGIFSLLKLPHDDHSPPCVWP
jgi:OFA family oxalate/formate antiporter-like MFS transporter